MRTVKWWGIAIVLGLLVCGGCSSTQMQDGIEVWTELAQYYEQVPAKEALPIPAAIEEVEPPIVVEHPRFKDQHITGVNITDSIYFLWKGISEDGGLCVLLPSNKCDWDELDRVEIWRDGVLIKTMSIRGPGVYNKKTKVVDDNGLMPNRNRVHNRANGTGASFGRSGLVVLQVNKDKTTVEYIVGDGAGIGPEQRVEYPVR